MKLQGVQAKQLGALSKKNFFKNFGGSSPEAPVKYVVRH